MMRRLLSWVYMTWIISHKQQLRKEGNYNSAYSLSIWFIYIIRSELHKDEDNPLRIITILLSTRPSSKSLCKVILREHLRCRVLVIALPRISLDGLSMILMHSCRDQFELIASNRWNARSVRPIKFSADKLIIVSEHSWHKVSSNFFRECKKFYVKTEILWWLVKPNSR